MESAEIVIEGGITVNAHTRLSTDFASMRTLVESGVPLSQVAEAFKVSLSLVKQQARIERWMTPSKIATLRRELEAQQGAVFRRSGKTMDVAEIKARIWQERGEEQKEKIHQVVMQALDGVTEDVAKRLIRSPQGLLQIAQTARLITGEEDKAGQNTQQVAVNVNFLRSQRPTEVVEAEVV